MDGERGDELSGEGPAGQGGHDEQDERGREREGAGGSERGDGFERAGDYEQPEKAEEGPSYEEDDEDEEEAFETVTIEINGLSLYTHHGVSDAEREIGQRLLIDLRLDVGEADATVTDRVQDTIDYAEVCQLVALIAQQRSYRTLERLCSAIADRLLSDFDLDGVWVKASKPEPPIALPVEDVSVEVWREAGE